MSDVDTVLHKLLADILGLTATTDFEALTSGNCAAWDSMRHLSVVLAVEETFGITFDELELAALTNYRDLRAAINLRRGR